MVAVFAQLVGGCLIHVKALCSTRLETSVDAGRPAVDQVTRSPLASLEATYIRSSVSTDTDADRSCTFRHASEDSSPAIWSYEISPTGEPAGRVCAKTASLSNTGSPLPSWP